MISHLLIFFLLMYEYDCSSQIITFYHSSFFKFILPHLFYPPILGEITIRGSVFLCFIIYPDSFFFAGNPDKVLILDVEYIWIENDTDLYLLEKLLKQKNCWAERIHKAVKR